MSGERREDLKMERDQEDLDLASFTVQTKSWPFLFQSHKDWEKISKPIQTLRTWYSRLLWSQRTNRSEKNLKYVSITSKCEHDDGRSVERTPSASHQQFSWGHSKDLIEGHDVIQKNKTLTFKFIKLETTASCSVQAKSWPFLGQSHKNWEKITKPIQTWGPGTVDYCDLEEQTGPKKI